MELNYEYQRFFLLICMYPLLISDVLPPVSFESSWMLSIALPREIPDASHLALLSTDISLPPKRPNTRKPSLCQILLRPST